MIAQTFLTRNRTVDRRGFYHESRIHLFDRDEPTPVVDGKLVENEQTAICRAFGEVASIWDAKTTQRLLQRPWELCRHCAKRVDSITNKEQHP